MNSSILVRLHPSALLSHILPLILLLSNAQPSIGAHCKVSGHAGSSAGREKRKNNLFSRRLYRRIKYYAPFRWKEKASVMEVPHDGDSSNFGGIIRRVESTPICGQIIAFSMAGVGIIK